MPIFLLTDIESSTRLWDTYHQAMLPALMKHNAILEEQITKHGGRILELRGDGVKAVFEGINPLQCMIDIQKQLGEENWGEIGVLKIRIGLHGVPAVRKGYDYFQKNDAYYGPVLNHTARIMDAGWGGQILVSEQIRNNCSLPEGAFWKEFGLHRVKSLDEPISIYGLMHPDLPIQSFPPLRTLDDGEGEGEVSSKSTAPLFNLPSQPTPFIGRKIEVNQLKKLLISPEIRLVSIVGPGGMGKTRLALAIADNLKDAYTEDPDAFRFKDGIIFIPLAPLNSADQILLNIAKELKIPFDSSQSSENIERSTQNIATLKDKLLGYLEAKYILIILDNFEHLLDSATMVSEILSAGESSKILITSRERLRIREEQVFPIEGLTFPGWDVPEFNRKFTAMEMFIQSAKRIKPDFEADMEDLGHITLICRLVGGMPLGLELAASWVDTMSLKDIAQEIQISLDFLETDIRNIPDRHRSIRAVFDSSWGRLSKSDQQVFIRLSIFRNEFSRKAAETVSLASIRSLSNFVNKSLLRFDQNSGHYQIHELLRQYGADKLIEDEADYIETHNRFCVFFCEEVKNHAELYTTGQTQVAIDKIDKDFGNIFSAWEWAVNHVFLNQINQALDGICIYYLTRWQGEEALSLCQNALDKVTQKPTTSPEDDLISEEKLLSRKLQSRILAWSGYFTINYQIEKAAEILQNSAEIVEELLALNVDAQNEKALTLFFQGLVQQLSGNLDTAAEKLQESLSLSRDIGYQWLVLLSLSGLGEIAVISGDPRSAKRWYEQCLSESRLHGNPGGEILSLRNLGWAARNLMAYDEAEDYYRKSLHEAESQGNHWEMVASMQSLGFLKLFLGNLDQARELFAQSAAKAKEIGMSIRMLPALVHVGITNWLMGDFGHAEDAINTALNMANEFSSYSQIFPRITSTEFLILVGRYSEAKAQINILNTSVNNYYIDHFLQARWFRVLGFLALAEKKYRQAENLFGLSIEHSLQITDDEQVAWSQAGLARALMGNGKWDEAHQSLTEAIWTAVEIRGFIPLVFTLPIALLYLAQDNPDSAGELYQQFKFSGFLVKAPYFNDIVYKFLPDSLKKCHPQELSKPDESNTDLWTAASRVLSSWIQLWIDTPVENQDKIRNNSIDKWNMIKNA
jgi:predicted ATPase/class 3 adenylate cyclase/tetratricopeptide (TPR) repeat protein